MWRMLKKIGNLVKAGFNYLFTCICPKASPQPKKSRNSQFIFNPDRHPANNLSSWNPKSQTPTRQNPTSSNLMIQKDLASPLPAANVQANAQTKSALREHEANAQTKSAFEEHEAKINNLIREIDDCFAAKIFTERMEMAMANKRHSLYDTRLSRVWRSIRNDTSKIAESSLAVSCENQRSFNKDDKSRNLINHIEKRFEELKSLCKDPTYQKRCTELETQRDKQLEIAIKEENAKQEDRDERSGGLVATMQSLTMQSRRG